MNFTKYSACNIAAVAKYGSLEFRNHEGTYDVERITKWINVLLLMKEAAISMEIPVEDIFSNISANGTDLFFRNVFHEYSVDLEYPNLEYDMYNGLRLAQDIIYSQKLDASKYLPKVGEEESAFAIYYKKRKPKRFKERYSEFKKHKGGLFGWRGEYAAEVQRVARELEGIQLEVGDNREAIINIEQEGGV